MISAYKLFITPMCPNCGELRAFLETAKLKGSIIDASTEEGLEEAKKMAVMSVPTAVFFDQEGKEVNRATQIEETKKIIEHKSLIDLWGL